MKRYQDLLNDVISFQDLTDDELVELRRCWIGEYNKFLPDEYIWDKARTEQDRRKVEKVRAGLAEKKEKRKKKFSKGFF